MPDQFKEVESGRITGLIERHPFAMLVTVSEGKPFVSYLPLLFDASIGSKGALLGHMARAN